MSAIEKFVALADTGDMRLVDVGVAAAAADSIRISLLFDMADDDEDMDDGASIAFRQGLAHLELAQLALSSAALQQKASGRC